MTTATPFTPPPIAPGEELVDKEQPGDTRLWSVTTIIGVLDKPALMHWAAGTVAQAAVTKRRTWQAMIEDGDEAAAVAWLKDFYARSRDLKGDAMSSTERGTLVHAAIEEYTITGIMPEVDPYIRPWVESFDRWAQRNSPVYEAAEVALYNLTYGYAGTCDCFLSIDGVPLIGDYKTAEEMTGGKYPKPTSPYPEVALQLAAYRYAELAATWRARRHTKLSKRYYFLSDAEKALGDPVPEVHGGVCIWVTPQRCAAYAVRCDEEVFDAFLYVQEAARYQFEMASDVIGDIVEVPS